jgi:hypothetical protein
LSPSSSKVSKFSVVIILLLVLILELNGCSGGDYGRK